MYPIVMFLAIVHCVSSAVHSTVQLHVHGQRVVGFVVGASKVAVTAYWNQSGSGVTD